MRRSSPGSIHDATLGLNDKSLQSYTISRTVKHRGTTMANLTNALQQLRAEQREAQLHVEKLGQAISVIESLNVSGTSRKTNQPKRIVSAASRRQMALAQKARWAKIRKRSQPAAAASAPVKRTMSASARRKIAAAQRARWAKVRAGRRKAA
jgi:hypothetical protein